MASLYHENRIYFECPNQNPNLSNEQINEESDNDNIFNNGDYDWNGKNQQKNNPSTEEDTKKSQRDRGVVHEKENGSLLGSMEQNLEKKIKLLKKKRKNIINGKVREDNEAKKYKTYFYNNLVNEACQKSQELDPQIKLEKIEGNDIKNYQAKHNLDLLQNSVGQFLSIKNGNKGKIDQLLEDHPELEPFFSQSLLDYLKNNPRKNELKSVIFEKMDNKLDKYLEEEKKYEERKRKEEDTKKEEEKINEEDYETIERLAKEKNKKAKMLMKKFIDDPDEFEQYYKKKKQRKGKKN